MSPQLKLRPTYLMPPQLKLRPDLCPALKLRLPYMSLRASVARTRYVGPNFSSGTPLYRVGNAGFFLLFLAGKAVFEFLGRTGPASHRDAARAHHLEHAVRLEHVEQPLDLVLGAGDLDDERVVGDVDRARAEDVGQLDDLAARRPGWPTP